MTLSGICQLTKTHSRILFLVVYEMMQRINSCGYQVMMFLFLKHEMDLALHNAIGVYHVYIGMSCIVPLVGTIVADLYLNKALSIVLVSLYALFGDLFLLLAASAFGDILPRLLPHVALLLTLGLILRAVGGGGVREIVRSLGNDQFVRPTETAAMLDFHQLLYYSMALGTITAFFVPPMLRMHTECGGQLYCFPISWLAATGCMLVGYVSILCGYVYMKKLTPGRSALIEFFLCVKAALGNLSGGGKYWIDNASHAYKDDFLDEMREVLQVLVLFIPLPVFWALFEQSGSRWVYQGSRMIAPLSTKANWFIEPDQMQTIIPIMILIVLPMFEYLFYPRLIKIKYVLSTPRQRVMFGAFLAVVAFVMAGFVQLHIEPSLTDRPHAGQGSLMLWNSMGSCRVVYNITSDLFEEPVIVDPLSVRLIRNLPVKGTVPYNYSLHSILGPPCSLQKVLTKTHASSALVELKVIAIFNSFVAADDEFTEHFPDDLIYSHTDRCDLQLPRVGVGYTAHASTVTEQISLSSNYPTDPYLIVAKRWRPNITAFLDPNHYSVDFFHVRTGMNRFIVSGELKKKEQEERLGRGEVMALMVMWFPGTALVMNATTLVPPLNISMYWQVPQYLTLSIAEFLFPMALVEYAHSQVSVRMKPVITSFYLLTVALGNLLVACLSFPNLFYREAYQYLMYTIMMAVDCLLLLVLLSCYKPHDVERPPPPLDRDESVESVRSVASNVSGATQRSTRSNTNGRCVVM